jgi:hypothetical protein
VGGERDDGNAVRPACVTEHGVASELQWNVGDQHYEVTLLFEQVLPGSAQQVGALHRRPHLDGDQGDDLPIDRWKCSGEILQKSRAEFFEQCV